ncbi:MAG TPA: hypothetical protein PLP19_13175 [bacterium]|nr:hypothetical protein [bacterium]HPN44438.1 hypothetical protein [bacterium]
MKKVLFLSILLCAAIAFAGPNYSGEWTLNKEKSGIDENGPGFRMFSGNLVVVHNNVLTVTRTGLNRDGQETKTEEKYTLDGKECFNKTEFREKTSTVTFSADGKTMTIKSVTKMNRDGNEFSMEGTEKWSLQADGKILFIDSTTNSPRGERTMQLYYDLKPKAAK